MISRPEDKPKAILLIVAIIAVLAFVVWNLRKALSPDVATTTPPVQPNPALMPPSALGNSAGNPQQPDGGYYAQFEPSTSMSDPAQVDPFRSPLPRAGTISDPGDSNPGTTSSGGGGGLQPVPSGGGLQPIPIEQVQASIQLKGIVSGAGSPMAVLKVGETTFNLFAGERITRDLWVTRITPTMCELSYYKQPIRLVIGQARMANMAPPKPKTTPRTYNAEPERYTAQPVEVVPNITELPDAKPAPRSTEVRPAYVEPPVPKQEPRPAPKPEPKAPAPSAPAVVTQPRPEEKPPAASSAPSKPSSPAPEMGPI